MNINTTCLYAAPFFLLACGMLLARVVSGQRLRALCPSAGDLLILSFVGLYMLVLIVGCRVLLAVEFVTSHFGSHSGGHQQPVGGLSRPSLRSASSY